ncbi:hypothetical protein [Vibrio furnissii]|uniref:hypothetical protein n=1 Tax=Vibrio furnissii TaxID=29494 RepID=UPI001559A477|nr:hypothetical protein [Vibrio furnissii]
MMNKLFKEIPLSIQEYLEQMDDYDDPCFMLIHTEQNIAPFINTINSVIDTEKTYSKVSIQASDYVSFYSLDCTHEVIERIVKKIHETLVGLNINIYQSAFRHNCLGEPKETFLWCCQLLGEAREEFSDNGGYKVNDFQDREKWPGIQKYMNQKT